MKPFNCSLLVLSLFLSYLKSLNCMPVVLSHSFFLSYLPRQYTGLHNPTVKQQMSYKMQRLLLLYQFWLTEICICRKPRPTRDETQDLQRTLMLPFFYTSGTPHARHIHASFELWDRLFCSSLLVSFFLLVLLWNEFTQLFCHISFLLFVQLTTCFLSSHGWLLDSCKHQLFCLHIQHATRLFEQQTPVGSSEAAVCGFCLSISLQSTNHYLTEERKCI